MMRRLLAPALAAAVTLTAAVPTPESHFGHRMGEDRKLLDWSKVVTYFQALGKSSDRIRVRELGKTTEGRPFIAAWIASPATLARLDHYLAVQQRLADPRRTTEEEAVKYIAEGKAVVMITCSIHSTEVASTSTAVQFAHDILTGDSPKFRAILDNVIFILVPSLNPDGVDKVTAWYRKTLGAPYEGTSPPELYQKYIGHDNNRDWYIFSQAETRLAVSQLHNVWHPQIVYDVHQQGANASRMFVPPWLDPIEPNIDPIIAQLCNMVGMGIAADLTAAGKKGVAVNAIYDFWTPARHYQAYHGGLRILTESASARLATPITVKPEEINETANGYLPRVRSWNYLEPWLGGAWRVSDILEYQRIAWESVLWQAAARREDFLRAFYAIGRNAIANPHPGFAIPKQQRDPGATRLLLDTLRFGMVEVEETGDAWLISMRQPYSAWVKTLLERQEYPDLRLYPGGPPRRPYDVTAHTLPLLMGVDVALRDQQTKPAAAAQPTASFWPAADTDSWRKVNAVWKRGATVWRDLATGDFSPNRRAGWSEIRRPRIGLYRSQQPSMDEGWTRWMLEQFGFAYRSVTNAMVLEGKLGAEFDAIVFPDQGPGTINNGYRPGSMPPEYTGGLGGAGAKALIDFAEAGGALIFLNDSALYAAGHLGVPVRNVLRGIPSRDFYCPGSLLNVKLDTSHRLTRGLPAELPIWFEGSPAWEIPSGGAKTVARYGDSGLLASGWLLGEKHLAGRAALLEAPMGKGSAILFGMRPQYRAQSYLTLKLLFNALLPERP
ncbi:MAG: M14 family metallopeptidase [Bryobacteraceae bacterium]